MTTTQTNKLIRLVTAVAAAAGILSGALGLAAAANASTTPPPDPHAPAVFQPGQKEGSYLPSRLQGPDEAGSRIASLRSQTQAVQQIGDELQRIQDFRNQNKEAPNSPDWVDGS